MELFKNLFEKLAEAAIVEGLLVKEENTILWAETVELVKEIEVAQLQRAMDKALDERDFETCRKLVALCK